MFFVLKNGRRIGPFSIDDLLEAVDEGRVDYEDDCEQSGSKDSPQKVREILDWDAPQAPADHPIREEPRRANTPPKKRASVEAAGPPADPNAILYAGHPSFLSFPKILFLVALAIGSGIWASQTYGGAYLVASLLIGVLGISYIQFQRTLRLFLITPKRVELIKGFITKSSNEVRIQDIRAINVKKRGFIGLLGVATVEFASAGSDTIEVSFSDIWAAQKVKRLVRRLQDSKRK